METGKKIRLSKIINPSTNRMCIVPLDHAVTMGPISGIENIVQTIQRLGINTTDAIVIHKGNFEKLLQHSELLRENNFICHLSASTSLGYDSNQKVIVSSVEQAIKYGAIGVSLHINLGNEYEAKMLRDLGKVAEQCSEWGMPLLAMMYVRNKEIDSYEGDAIAHAARVAQELGADIVKVNCPRNVYDLKKIVQGVDIPVVISGGERVEQIESLRHTYEALEMGIAGVCIGRNIFQAENSKRFMTILSDLVHKRIEITEAEARLTNKF